MRNKKDQWLMIIKLTLFVVFVSFNSCAVDEEQTKWSNNGVTLSVSYHNIPNHQSFVIYNDTILFIDLNGNCFVYSTKEERVNNQIALKYNGFNIPHANVACFGVKSDNSSIFPLLYVSQWDGEGGCLVYDFNKNYSGELEAVWKQTIIPKNLPEGIIGKNLGDWVVDANNEYLYSIKYHNYSSELSNGNCVHIAKFKLPSLLDGNYIELSENDVLDNFDIPFIPIMQDKLIKDELMYIAAGGTYNTQKIIIVDLRNKTILNQVDLVFFGGEPEGFFLKDGEMFLSYYSHSELYSLSYK